MLLTLLLLTGKYYKYIVAVWFMASLLSDRYIDGFAFTALAVTLNDRQLPAFLYDGFRFVNDIEYKVFVRSYYPGRPHRGLFRGELLIEVRALSCCVVAMC